MNLVALFAAAGWMLAIAALFKVGDLRRESQSLWVQLARSQHQATFFEERAERLERELALYGSVAKKDSQGATP